MFDPNFLDLSNKGYTIGTPICDSDEFRMYIFKIKKCPRNRSHDWTECPFMHRGEKAKRRDPRKFNYSAVACPRYRYGECKKGNLCELAHGVFEFWLHPARYRTRMCNAGANCQRKVCFFAHTQEQLRAGVKNKFQLCYGACSNESKVGERIEDGLDCKIATAGPFMLMKNENYVELNWDFLESLRGLKIRYDEEDESDLPDIDWISELVK